MIEIKQYKKIYITSIYEKTGGPKTLHQLAEFLVNQGVDVYMVYFENVGEFVSKDELLYEINGVKMAPSIIDSEDNLLIVPEANADILHQYKYIKKVVWWLSLDYYLMISNAYRTKRKLYLKNIPFVFYPAAYLYFKLTLHERQQLSDSDFQEVFHLYNCKYVEDYLKKKKVSLNHMHYLCGPLEEYFVTLDEKEIK